jgi:CDP-glucose 4,6-dehydratase
MGDWQGIKVAVTGGTGFVGRHLVSRLLEYRAEVTALVRDMGFEDEPNLKQVRGDLRNSDDVERLIYESTPHVIFHLGAVAPVGHGLMAPRQTIDTNVMGTTHVLSAAHLAGGIPVIISSSDKSYGKPATLPVTEDMPLNPRHPYDASKAAADLIAMSYVEVYKMPVYIVRCANIFGPGDTEWSRLIPGCIKAFLHDREFLIRSDGSSIRDYIYIDDVIDAFVMLGTANMISPNVEGMIWNISARQTRSVNEVVEAIWHLTGEKGEFRVLARAHTETDNLTVDCSRFRERFEWEPKAEFAQGLGWTVDWYADYFGLP